MVGPSAVPAPVPGSPPGSSDHSGSEDGSSSSDDEVSLPPYTHEEVNKLRAERDSVHDELGEVSKKFGIAELEWEDERRQYLARIAGRGICKYFSSHIHSVF